jgi:hypothetical protein
LPHTSSERQSKLQPSPLSWLPSSHCSLAAPASWIPSPQRAGWQLGATGRVGRQRVGAAGVARLVEERVDDTVATHRAQAGGLTAITIDRVAVVAGLAGTLVDHAVATRLERPAVAGAAIAGHQVAVVAQLASVELRHGVAAAGRHADAVGATDPVGDAGSRARRRRRLPVTRREQVAGHAGAGQAHRSRRAQRPVVAGDRRWVEAAGERRDGDRRQREAQRDQRTTPVASAGPHRRSVRRPRAPDAPYEDSSCSAAV